MNTIQAGASSNSSRDHSVCACISKRYRPGAQMNMCKILEETSYPKLARRKFGHMSAFRILFATCCLSIICGVSHAQDVTVPIKTCGDLGYNNTPNWCARPTNSDPVQGKSQCKKITDNRYEYTHCAGGTREITGSSLCCLQSSECPGAYYVGECIN